MGNDKYEFIKIRMLDSNNKTPLNNNDSEQSFLLSSSNHSNNFNISNLCLLFNVNTRYEGYALNLKLRQSYFKENFKIISLSSLIDLTIPTFYLGSTTNTIKNLCEGNHIICQEISSSLFPILISNFENLTKNNSISVTDCFQILTKYNKKIYNTTWNGFNMLSTTKGIAGLNLLNSNFLNFSSCDINYFNC